MGDASGSPTFWASRPGYEKAMISIEFKYHSTQKASHRIKRIFIHIFCGHVLELITAGIFYGFLNTVEPLGTDTSLLRTVSNVPAKFSHIFFKENLYNTDSL